MRYWKLLEQWHSCRLEPSEQFELLSVAAAAAAVLAGCRAVRVAVDMFDHILEMLGGKKPAEERNQRQPAVQ